MFGGVWWARFADGSHAVLYLPGGDLLGWQVEVREDPWAELLA